MKTANIIFSACMWLLLSLVLIPGGNSSKARELIDKVAAVVNDEVITLSEVREELKKRSRGNQKLSEKEVLDQIIEEKLIEQEGKKLGVSVSDEEVNSMVEAIKARYNLEEKGMEKVLSEQNISFEEFKEQLKMQLLTKKVLDKYLTSKIAVTDQEIEKYYIENYGEISPAEEVRISHILIPKNSPNALEEAKRIAELARSEKEDFSKLAKRYSKDQASAPNGGDLGFFRIDQMIEPIAKAIKGIEPGKVVGPVETSAGYHIIKVTGKKTSDEKIPETVREEIKNTLYRKKLEEQLRTWLNDVKQKAYIEKKI